MKKQYIIALAALIVICIGLFFLTHFSKATILSTEGYFVPNNKIEENLLSEDKHLSSANIKLEKVSYNDSFYVNLNKLYVGEEKKKSVNDVYPIFSNDGKAIVNLNEKGKLINNKFEYFASYENFTLTGGKLYNYGDNEQADFENYIFLQLANSTYINLCEIKLKTNTKEYIIPVNSIINFQEDYLKYYYYDNSGKLIYQLIEGIDLSNLITMNDIYFTYKHLLINFDKLTENETEIDKGNTNDLEKPKDENENQNNNGDISKPGKIEYVKPKVMVDNFKASVYSATAKLNINDPSGAIIGGVSFQFKTNDKIFLRKNFINSGEIEIVGLIPKTNFSIIGSYKYYNENKKKMEVKFFEQEIKTNGIENLEPIELKYKNGPIFPDKIQINDLEITSDLKSESIKGISKITIIINGETYFMPSGIVNEIINGNKQKYISPPRLESNKKINYEIKLLDNFGNNIKLICKKGSTRTAKEKPVALVKVVKNEVNTTFVSIKLKNKDAVKINPYRYVVYNNEMVEVKSGTLDSGLKSQNIELKNLNPNSTYVIKIIGNYNIEDGNGVLKDVTIGEGKFTTLPLSSLGFFRVITSTDKLTNNSAQIISSFDLDNISPILINLLNYFTINIYDEENKLIYTKTYQNNELDILKSGEEIVDYVENLNSVTEYRIEYKAKVIQGSIKEEISVLSTLNKFKTLKKPAEVNIINKFVNGEMIDFDVKIIDIDNAIESGRVIIEVRDSNEKLIAMESVKPNQEYRRLIYEKLSHDQNYTFTYKVEEYNIGYDNSTYESDYTLYKETIFTTEGIYGQIELIELLRQMTGKNLFNIKDYSRIRKEGNIGTKEYDIKNNIMRISAKNGYINYSYFLPEMQNKIIEVSFEAKYTKDSPNTAPVYLGRNYGQNLDYKLDNLSKDKWQKYNFKYTQYSNYVGFVINETASQNKKTEVEFRNIKIIDKNNLEETAKNDVTLSYHESGYKFSNPKMYSGDEEMPSHEKTNDTMIGNSGNGFARITNVKTKEVKEYKFTGKYSEFVCPVSGKYKVELWGAQGGSEKRYGRSYEGGKGAYTSGYINLNKGYKLYIYVGENPTYVSGSCYSSNKNDSFNASRRGSCAGGGGATDVRLVSGEWDDSKSLASRIMVAAGGGGCIYIGHGGAGGKLVGINGIGTNQSSTAVGGKGASQTRGFSFGKAGSSTTIGGGGYYGAEGGSASNAGGGSSYISGYKGCVAYNVSTENDDTGIYSEKDEYLGSLKINLNDSKNEIPTDDFYIRIFIKDELQKIYNYNLENNKIENFKENYDFKKNKQYTIKLSVKIRDRFYDIDTLEFGTSSEIRTITNIDQFFSMHPSGNYIVANDLDFTKKARSYWSTFYGNLDFQGHKMIWNVNGRNSYIFYSIGAGATVKNIVVDARLDNTSNRNWFYGIGYSNSGTIDNLMINVLESMDQPNYGFVLGFYLNYGTIKNFVINCQAPMSAQAVSGTLVWSNQGTIRNGYVYGENIKAYFESPNRRKDVAGISGEATTNSRIENVFSLITVEKNSNLGSETSVGNILGYSTTGILQNVYSVEDETKINTNLLNKDPNIGTVNSINSKNVFYSSQNTYKANYSTKISKQALYDSEFQNKVLNKHNGFIVDKFVELGYYPQVKMNECMPAQEWIPLPRINEDDLVDITSSEVIESNGEYAIVSLNINNPGAEKIVNIGIEDIKTVEIISQTDEWGKTKLKVKLSNPTKYKSKYYVRNMKIKGSLGFEYEKTYGQYERGLDIDLYYPIKNLNDWKLISENPNQNYILKSDLDFKNEVISKYVINNTFKGKLNGNGHTIKNIKIVSNNALFNQLYGTIKNLNVENYEKENKTSYGGLIYQSSSNAVIDNVHIKNSTIAANNYIGGIVGYGSNTTIKNSSVTNFKSVTLKEREDIRIGGLAGYLSNSLIQNSFTQNVNIIINDAISTYGIGGIIGQMGSGTIENVYSTGKIESNSLYVGGIVGYGNAKVSNAWSNIDIKTEHEYVGGIVGQSTSTNVHNTLSTGSIYSSYVGEYIHRTNGNALVNFQNNYAWNEQKFHGYVTGDASSEKLLTSSQLQDKNTYYDSLNLGDYFDYTKLTTPAKNDGQSYVVLPKLKNYETKELLPNQQDTILIPDSFVIKEPLVDATVTNATIRFEITNSEPITITGIEFDYLDIIDSKINKIDNTIIVEAKVKPNKYYDSYSLKKIIYKTADGTKKEYNHNVKIELQFYKTISKFEDWQNISQSDPENYRLIADIDFAGKYNVKNNIVIARLEGQDQGYTLKNYKINPKRTGFSLIRKITKSMSNVTFENFDISTTGSGNFVNIINYNFADLNNINFKNIKMHAPSASYVAPIGRNRGFSLNNISIEGNDIKGVSYIGGLVAYSLNYDTTNIKANNVKVFGSNRYIGGIMGYKEYSNPAKNFSYNATNMNVTGKTDVGGMFGYGGANDSTITDSNIKGLAGGSYVGSFSGRNGQYYGKNIEVRRCNVYAEANNYVGGAFGWTYDMDNLYVYDTNVTQDGTSNSYTGGVTGLKGYGYSNVGITNSTVKSNGTGTGGLFGYMDSSARNVFVNKTKVIGVNKVGGAVGYGTSATLYNAIINADVIGNGMYVGGAWGYINNIDDENSSYSSSGYRILIANTIINGNNYIGGYAGYTPQQLTPKFFYDTIIVANINAQVSTGDYGPITGFDKVFKKDVDKFYIYENNKINDKPIKNLFNNINMQQLDLKLKENLVNANNLGNKDYYLQKRFSSSYWIYNDLEKGFYPKLKTPKGQQLDIKRPIDAVTYSLRSIRPLGHSELPKYTIYSSGASTLNIEFDKIDKYSYLEIYEENKKIVDQSITNRTFTINYNYKSDLKFVITDGLNKKEVIYKAKDLINKVSTVDNKYAYIYNGKLKGNIISPKDTFIHIHGKEALTKDLKLYDISKGNFISEKNIFNVELLTESIPLYKFKINGIDIETYATYSIIHRNDKDIIYDKQIFVKNNTIEVIDTALDNKKDSLIIDNYAKDNYATILGNDGTIYNLKQELKFPTNFKNKNIKYMSNNIYSKSSAIVIMYDTGKVVTFDYRTGKLIKEEKATEDITVVDYFKKNLSKRKSLVEGNVKNNYNDSIKLKKQLEDNPIIVNNEGDYSYEETNNKKPNNNKFNYNTNYISYYNAVTNKYDIIDVTEIVETGKENVITENDKIYTSPDLVEIYMNESFLEKIFGNINVLVIFITILIGILLAMIFWIVNIKLLKVSEES